MKRKVFLLSAVLVLLIQQMIPGSLAEKYFLIYYLPGEHTIEITDAKLSEYLTIVQKALASSEGTPARIGIDHETVEEQYELYQQMIEDGFKSPAVKYDDIGNYYWIPGLPDENSISFQTAWIIAVSYLVGEQGISLTEMEERIPQTFFEVGDAENPIWKLIFVNYRNTQKPTYEVCIYANDGSVQGYRTNSSVG